MNSTMDSSQFGFLMPGTISELNLFRRTGFQQRPGPGFPDILRDLQLETPRMHFYMPVDNRSEKFRLVLIGKEKS